MTTPELHSVLGLMRNPYGRDPQQVRDAVLKAADELERLHPNTPSLNDRQIIAVICTPGSFPYWCGENGFQFNYASMTGEAPGAYAFLVKGWDDLRARRIDDVVTFRSHEMPTSEVVTLHAHAMSRRRP